jgi:prepilin-type N-terminal cleavage/methylation domain-containing protein
MKIKGFTLIELLGVIVILSIILAIAIPAISSVLKSSKDNLYNVTVSNVKDAAREYVLNYGSTITGLEVEGGGTGLITLGDLIEKDILEGPVNNPKTDMLFDSDTTYIKITKLPNGTYQFVFPFYIE